mgnify:CR=1 FL=1
MIIWPVVILAFMAGVTVVILLESKTRRERTGGLQKIWLAILTICSLGMAANFLFSWNFLAEQNQLASFSIIPQKMMVPDTAVSTLPPPSIFVFSEPGRELTSTAEPQSAALAIPDIGVDATVIVLPLRDGSWDVSHLSEQVGLLQGFGEYPGDDLAMVFAGHMTFPSSRNLQQGAFANLQYAIYGTELSLDFAGEQLAYEVVEISRVQPDEVDKLLIADGNSILLVTCTDWDENGRVYANRLLVRAEKVESDAG